MYVFSPAAATAASACEALSTVVSANELVRHCVRASGTAATVATALLKKDFFIVFYLSINFLLIFSALSEPISELISVRTGNLPITRPKIHIIILSHSYP